MPMKHCLRAALCCTIAASAISSARAAVTLQEMDVVLDPTKPTVTTPCWVFDNPYFQFAINKSTGKMPALIKKTDPGKDLNQCNISYPSFAAWVNQKNVTTASLVYTANSDGDDSDAKRSLKITSTILTGTGFTFNFTRIIRVRDTSKAIESELTFENTDTANDWLPSDPYNGAIDNAYMVPGGTMTGAYIFAKTASGLETPTATCWYGATGTRPELSEGWMAGLNTGNTVVNAVTWDFASQKAHGADGVSATSARIFGSRYQIAPSFMAIKAAEALTYKQYLILDDGMPSISYAAPESLLAGIGLPATSFPQGQAITATFYLNSTKSADAASYDIKNIQLVDSTTGTKVLDVPALTGIAVAANAHATATRQFVANAPAGTYILKGDLYPAGGTTPITTLVTKTITLTPADQKVLLYTDPSTGQWVLENEKVKAVIDPATARVVEYVIKESSHNVANPSYVMLRDYINNSGTGYTFSGFYATADPAGTDSATKKSISFNYAYNAFANLNKTFVLESMSKSLQVDFEVQNAGSDVIPGQGFYSDLPLNVGGTGGPEDQFTAKAASGLLAPHTASTRYWFGVMPQADNSVTLAGAQPALSEPWMAVSDTTAAEAVALTWDSAKWAQYSQIPTDGTSSVPMAAVYQAGDFNRHVLEAHFTNIPVGDTLKTTHYVVADDGIKLASYAEGKRALAGVWTDGADVHQNDALAIHAVVSNVGVTNRTFDLKNIRLVKDTGESTSAGSDITAIAVAAGARSANDISFTIPAAQPTGVYTVQADLYESGTKVSTLQSLPFNVVAGVVIVKGDVDGNGTVEPADVVLALRIASGLVASDAGNVQRGDVAPATADNAIDIQDAVAVARKVAGL